MLPSVVVPGGNAVAPPELAADAPVLDVAHPLEVGLRPVVRHEADAAVLDRRDRRLRERRDAHVPLVGEPGLEDGAASGRRAAPAACAASIFSSSPAASRSATMRLRASKRSRPRYAAGHCVVERRVGREDVDQRQRVALADLVVVEVVRRRDLDAAGAERRVDVVVGDDRDLAVGERQPDLLADQVPVALVVRMHGDGGVAEHRLRARRGDDECGRCRPPSG